MAQGMVELEQQERQEAFIAWLREELRTRGWSQAELARRAGISNQQVSVVLLAQQRPGLRFIEAMARAFEMSPAEMGERAGRFPVSGDLLPALVDINRRLRALPERQQATVLRAFTEILRAVETAAHHTE